MDRFAPILPRQLGIAPAADAGLPAVAPAASRFAAVGPDSGADDDAATAQYRAKATEAAVKFESFFIGDMLHRMRSSTNALKGDDEHKDSINSDMLDMADNLVADQLARQRAFGVADAILRQLLPQSAPVAPHLPGVPMPLAPAPASAAAAAAAATTVPASAEKIGKTI